MNKNNFYKINFQKKQQMINHILLLKQKMNKKKNIQKIMKFRISNNKIYNNKMKKLIKQNNKKILNKIKKKRI